MDTDLDCGPDENIALDLTKIFNIPGCVASHIEESQDADTVLVVFPFVTFCREIGGVTLLGASLEACTTTCFCHVLLDSL